MREPSVEIVPLPNVLRDCFGRFASNRFYPRVGRKFFAAVEELDLRGTKGRKLLLSALNGVQEFRKCWSGREWNDAACSFLVRKSQPGALTRRMKSKLTMGS